MDRGPRLSNRALGLLMACLMGTLALASIGPGAAQSVDGAPLIEFEDPRGDVRPSQLGIIVPTPVGIPPGSPAHDMLDLQSIRLVEETPADLVIEFTVEDLEAAYEMPGGIFGFFYYVAFTIPGVPFTYRVTIDPPTVLTPPPVGPSPPERDEWMAYLEVRSVTCCWLQYMQAEATAYPFEDRVEVVIPRLAIIGQESSEDRPGSSLYADSPPPEPLPTRLGVGDTFQLDYVQSVRRDACYLACVEWSDAAPEQDLLSVPAPLGSHAFQMETANTIIEVDLANKPKQSTDPFAPPGPPPNQVGVVAGRSTTVELLVTNGADGKRLIRLDATAPGESGLIEASIAESVEVAAGASAKLTLRLNVSSSIEHRAKVPVHVSAVSEGHPQETGFIAVDVIGSVPPSATRNVLYFHAGGSDPAAPVGGPVCVACGARSYWANTLQDDSSANLDDGVRGTSLIIPGFSSTALSLNALLDTPLPNDLWLDTTVHARATLAFKAPQAFTGTAYLTAFAVVALPECSGGCNDQVHIGGGQAPISVSSGGSSVDLTFALNPEHEHLRTRGGTLRFNIMLLTEDAAAVAAMVDPVQFIPGQSQVQLPLTHPGVVTTPVEAEALTFGLYSADGEVEEFINAAETRAFHLLLANEGATEDILLLNATLDQPGWKAAFFPAEKYRLGPGQSINVTAQITAAHDAEEGTKTSTMLALQSLNGTAGVRQLAVTTIVTTVDMPNETHLKSDDPAAMAAAIHDEQQAESPGAGLVAMVVATLGLAWAHRRRAGRD